MKRLLLISLLSILSSLALAQEATMPEAVRIYHEEVINNLNLDALEQSHVENPGFNGNTRAHTGRENVGAWVEMMHSVYDDLQMIDEEVIVQGDLVMVRSRITGTYRGAEGALDSQGVPEDAVGKQVDYARWGIYQIEDGRIAMTWALEDDYGRLVQLGAIEDVMSSGGGMTGGEGVMTGGASTEDDN